jgi:large subunit ribosomal protein L30
MLRIKLVKSTVGHNWRNRRTVQALGLRKPHQVVEHADTPSIRGMIHHVRDLLHVEEVPGDPAPKKKAASAASSSAVEEKPKKTRKPKAEATAEEK